MSPHGTPRSWRPVRKTKGPGWHDAAGVFLLREGLRQSIRQFLPRKARPQRSAESAEKLERCGALVRRGRIELGECGEHAERERLAEAGGQAVAGAFQNRPDGAALVDEACAASEQSRKVRAPDEKSFAVVRPHGSPA